MHSIGTRRNEGRFWKNGSASNKLQKLMTRITRGRGCTKTKKEVCQHHDTYTDPGSGTVFTNSNICPCFHRSVQRWQRQPTTITTAAATITTAASNNNNGGSNNNNGGSNNNNNGTSINNNDTSIKQQWTPHQNHQLFFRWSSFQCSAWGISFLKCKKSVLVTIPENNIKSFFPPIISISIQRNKIFIRTWHDPFSTIKAKTNQTLKTEQFCYSYLVKMVKSNRRYLYTPSFRIQELVQLTIHF